MQKKNKEPTLRVTTRPNDANPNGDIFGGWLMSQIDIAGAIEAVNTANCQVATVAVKSLHFIQPLYVYDLVSFYTEVVKKGNTSITVAIEVYAHRKRNLSHAVVKIAVAEFVYVAISAPGQKRKISE